MAEPQNQGKKRPDEASQSTPWALKLITIAGIPVRLHITFFMLLAWMATDRRIQAWSVVVLFVCVVLHEIGHSMVARRFGIPVLDITLYPIGGIARIDKTPKPAQELWIALAGPAVNVLIAVFCFAVNGPLRAHPKPGFHEFMQWVLAMNIVLAVFNLIPAFPMDGGRVLRAILAMKMPQRIATRIAATVGQVLAMGFGVLGIVQHQTLWVLAALFIYLGAAQESMSVNQMAALEGVKVREAMITDVHTLSVGNSLKEAADVLLTTSQHDFPVVFGAVVQGVLTRNGLLRGLSDAGATAYVAGVMNREFPTAAPEDDLAESLRKLPSADGMLVVLDPKDQDRLVGMVTFENVQEFLVVRQIALSQSRG